MEDKVCLLIPAYNAEKTLSKVVAGALKYAKIVIVVNDGSTDNTTKSVASLDIINLEHEQNRGKGGALKTGFEYIIRQLPHIEAVITLDADAQHDPNEIPVFLDYYKSTNADMIIGARDFTKANVPLVRRLANSFGRFAISYAAGMKILDTQSGYRLYKISALKEAMLTTTGFEAETELILRFAKQGFRIDFIPIQTIYQLGENNQSHFRPIRDFMRIAKVVIRAKLLGI